MDSLRKHGFTIGVVAMILGLGAFGWVWVWGGHMARYGEFQNKIASNAKKLQQYADMDVTVLPTPYLVELKTDELQERERARADAVEYLAEIGKKLDRLQFQPGGETFTALQTAAMQAAFQTAMAQLNERLVQARLAYAAKVLPPAVLADRENITVLSATDRIQVESAFTDEASVHDAARKCRIVHAVAAAALDAEWGGLTGVVFERARAGVRPAEPPAPTRPTTRPQTRPAARGKAPAAKKIEVVPADPRDLCERIPVRVFGEIRFEDIGPFLRQLELRAQDRSDPVMFVVDELNVTTQGDRLPQAVYINSEVGNEDAARALPLDAENKVPTATLRLNLSVLKWKGFPVAGAEER